MYINGVEVGENTYLLSEENGNLTVINGNNGKEELEDYIKLNNTLEKQQEHENNLQSSLVQIVTQDELARGINRILSLVPIMVGITFSITGHLDFISIIVMTVLLDSFGLWLKLSLCGTKKKRTQERNDINSEIIEIKNLIQKLENQINILKEKNEYKELDIQEEQIIPITTLEAKKEKAKMRVLKLN